MRRAFTLIELLVIIAIIGAMSAVGAISLVAGRGAMRVRGATRDIFAAIRHARSVALVSQQPAIIEYSVVEEDGEPVAKVTVTTARLFAEAQDRSKIRTVTGAPLPPLPDDGETSADGGVVGDVLFAPISDEVVRGMRLKVLKGDERLDAAPETRKSRISVFSNVDYLLGKYGEMKSREKEETEKADAGGDAASAAPAAKQDPVSVVWETNGRVEPHRVWVYPDGSRPEDGLMIEIDMFGAAKVVAGGEK